MNKTCTICKDGFPPKAFNKNKRNEDGLQNICRKCSNEISKKYYNLNKQKHIKAVQVIRKGYVKRNKKFAEIVKLQFGCFVCDESDPCCIDFHHLGNKSDNVSHLVGGGYSMPTLLAEINKCVCVCANCHRKIHAGKLSTANLSTMLLRESEVKAKMQTLEQKQ